MLDTIKCYNGIKSSSIIQETTRRYLLRAISSYKAIKHREEDSFGRMVLGIGRLMRI